MKAKIRHQLNKFIKLMASLKIAVVIILLLAGTISVGTFVEARYDAAAAAKMVYHTPWMFFVLGWLSLTLIAVMVDRWPWKKRHTPFILAHIGILVLLLGAVITMKYGLDGNMRFGIGEKNHLVTVQSTDLQVWSSFDGDRYSKIIEQEVDFFSKSPKEHPFKVDLDEGELQIKDYMPYVFASRQVVASESSRVGAGIRFQIQNERVNVNDWLLQAKKGQEAVNNFGPAQLTLGEAPKVGRGANELFLTPKDDEHVNYVIFYKDPSRKPLRGVIKEGESFDTGWMALQFRLLRYFPRAEEKYDFKPADRPTPMTTSAILVSYLGKDHWVQLNDVLKLFTDKAVYILTYGQKRIDLGFDLQLKNFEVGRYQGTTRAASYQSLVTTPNGSDTLISMNEPLKYNGLTFYQASFQDGPNGQPIASVLSVNYDPGRWLKYLGSLILTVGVVALFYNKRKAARAQAPRTGDL